MEENYYFYLRWEDESCVDEVPEPEEYIYEYEGEVFIRDSYENEEVSGRFRCYYVDVVRAFNDKRPIFDVLDAHSDPVALYYEPIFEPTDNGGFGVFGKKIGKVFKYEITDWNLLILDILELLPQYRGEKHGLQILRHMIKRFGAGAGIFAMKPFPLQFDCSYTRKENLQEKKSEWDLKMCLDNFTKDEEVATKKLCKYYGKLNFVKIPGTPLMARSSAHHLPKIKNDHLTIIRV